MDPNPKKFPILSYVLSKLPSSNRSQSPDSEFDIEQPPPPTESSPEKPYFELAERMPYLNDPDLIAAMRSAVKDVSTTRSVLKTLGEPPDHELVDIARAKLQVINLNDNDNDKESVDSETASFKAVIKLYEMHEAYEKMLTEAEKRLEKLYEAAKKGGKAVVEDSEEEGSCSEIVDDELVRIMKDAIVNNVEKVDLSDRRLPFLPEAFGQCRMLVSLNLSSNQLEVIPDSIAGLENLEELYASSNHLESLPDTIGLLLKLKVLNVSSNKLTSLPNSICQCRSLVELDAGFNKLTYIPTNIGYELVNLKKLSVPLNKLRSLPTSIGEMESLEILDAHFNELRVLPPSIGRLSKLQILNLNGNFSDLTSLPHTIGDLTNLEELDISNNQIRELPVTFGRLEKLTKLNLEENPLETPPKEVVKAGVEAVKQFMALRLLDFLVKEEEKSNYVEKVETQAGWLTRSTSWLTNAVAGAVGNLGGEGSTKNKESYLDEQF